jgi:hypothetical protein
VEDSYGDSSSSSYTPDGPLFLISGSSLITTVSALARPLLSMMNLTSVRVFGAGNSGIEVKPLGRLTGEIRPPERDIMRS